MSKTHSKASYSQCWFRHPKFHHQAQKAVYFTIDQLTESGFIPRPRELQVLVRSPYDDIIVSNWKYLLRQQEATNDKNSSK